MNYVDPKMSGARLPSHHMIDEVMKSADFKGKLTPDGQIVVPPDIAALVPPGAQIQVLQWGILEDDRGRRSGKTIGLGAPQGGDVSRPRMPPTTRTMYRG